jgi:hypothetical protein
MRVHDRVCGLDWGRLGISGELHSAAYSRDGWELWVTHLRKFAMESAPHRPTAEEIADLVVKRLVEGGGIPDLANANLMTIEELTIKEVDRVTQIVMSELLAQQSREAQPVTSCPKCGNEMTPKKAQHRSLQGRRGPVKFKTDVSHCEACRLDFFPSDENAAV